MLDVIINKDALLWIPAKKAHDGVLAILLEINDDWENSDFCKRRKHVIRS